MRRHGLIPLLRAATCQCPHVFSSDPVQRTKTLLFTPATPRNCQGIDDENHVSDTCQLAPGGSAHPSRPCLGHFYPLIFDREALRASAHSLCTHIPYSLNVIYLRVYPRTFASGSFATP